MRSHALVDIERPRPGYAFEAEKVVLAAMFTAHDDKKAARRGALAECEVICRSGALSQRRVRRCEHRNGQRSAFPQIGRHYTRC